jgi:hypothetical protein
LRLRQKSACVSPLRRKSLMIAFQRELTVWLCDTA